MGARLNQCGRYTAANHGRSGSTEMKHSAPAVRGAPLQIAILVLLCLCVGFAAETKSTEWPTYGHDAGGMRFSPLKQITPANVAKLQRAWMYHMKRSDTVPFAGSSSTPLVVNGVMYAGTP